jgi:undecaprenyl phosphate-alpha-L-ara4N flippase subunit ArnE
MDRITIIILTLAAVFAAIGQLLFRVGANGRQEIMDFINFPIFLGLIFYAAGTIIWIYALANEKLVNVYAFTALTFVLVYIGGVGLLGERLHYAGMVGVLLVLAGLYFITSG